MSHSPGDIAFRTLFVSFSVILLGIFIFLNAFATPDQSRFASAVNSIERTFASNFDVLNKSVEDSSMVLPSDIRELFPEKSQVETIGAIEAMIEGGRLSSKKEKDDFHIFIPIRELFVARDVQVRAEFLPILQAVAQYCKVPELACELRINEHSDENEGSLDALEKASRYAQTLYRTFLDYGVSPADLEGLARQIRPSSRDSRSKSGNAQLRITRKTEGAGA